MTSKPFHASETTMTEYVLPTHANALGTVFGGQIMAWIDLCAAICAQRHTGSIVVTAGIDDLSFDQSIQVGQVVRLSARVTATFRTSLEIFVQAQGEDAISGKTWPCVEAFVTFVAVQEKNGTLVPINVPTLELTSEQDHRLSAAGHERRALRLSRRRKPLNL